MSLIDCRLIEFPKIQDPRGSLTVIENNRHVPFEIKRVYYLYDVPAGETRAGHAHRDLHQVLIALSGSFDVQLDDGKEKKLVHLNRPFFGLYIRPLVWRVLENFSSGSVCLSIVSDFYQESDYFRDYNQFLQAAESIK